MSKYLCIGITAVLFGCEIPHYFSTSSGNECSEVVKGEIGRSVACRTPPMASCTRNSRSCWILFDRGPTDAGRQTQTLSLCDSCCSGGVGGFGSNTACAAVSCSSDTECPWSDHHCEDGVCRRTVVCLSSPPTDGGPLCAEE